MAVMLSGWEGNRGPGGKIAAYRRVYDYVTCGLTA